jgi:hypothetical protein
VTSLVLAVGYYTRKEKGVFGLGTREHSFLGINHLWISLKKREAKLLIKIDMPAIIRTPFRVKPIKALLKNPVAIPTIIIRSSFFIILFSFLNFLRSQTTQLYQALACS